MVELVIVACLLGQPAKCEKFFVAFQQPTQLRRCLSQAQPRALEWSRAHPRWRIKGWACEAPET